MCVRCEELEERVAWLEGELGIQRVADHVLALRQVLDVALREQGAQRRGRNQSAELVMALYRANGRPLSRYQLLDAIPSPTGRERDAKIVDVWVCIARKGIGADAIENVWGRGYRLSQAGIARVAEALGQRAAV